MSAPPVVPCASGAICWADGVGAGACWGQVDVIDEDDPGTELATWVHGCEAHRDRGEVGVLPPPERR